MQKYITTISLNPALDRIYRIADFTPHNFYRLKEAEQIETGPGGKGVRISIGLQRYGHHTATMGFLGGQTGRNISESLHERGIATFFSFIENETRTNTIVYDPKNKTLTEIVQPGPKIEEEDIELLLEDLKIMTSQTKFFILAGSIPEGCNSDIYKVIIEDVIRNNSECLLHASPELIMQSCSSGVEYVCPDLRGIHEFNGKPLISTEDYIQAGKIILQENPKIKAVLFINHIESPIAVCSEKSIVLKPRDLSIANMLGYGDVFLAGFVNSLCLGKDFSESFLFGFAAGLSKVESHLSFGDNLPPAESYIDRIEIETIEYES